MEKTIYLTFYTTQQSIIKMHWKKQSVLLSSNVVGTNKSIDRDVDLGGIVICLDFETKTILHEHHIAHPGGTCLIGDKLLVSSQRKNNIDVLDSSLRLAGSFTNPFFNNIHSIYYTKDNTLLMTSTGLDMIIELSISGQMVWQWFAFEHGYPVDMLGNIRSLDKSLDFSEVDYPSLFHTTHINSAIPDPTNEGKIIATLFHQGSIVRIDKKTNKVEVLVDGLTQCHSLQKTQNGFLCSNTKSGEVVFFDSYFNRMQTLSFESGWIQDATITPWETLLVGDSDNNKVIECNPKNGAIISTYDYNPEWRVFQIVCKQSTEQPKPDSIHFDEVQTKERI